MKLGLVLLGMVISQAVSVLFCRYLLRSVLNAGNAILMALATFEAKQKAAVAATEAPQASTPPGFPSLIK